MVYPMPVEVIPFFEVPEALFYRGANLISLWEWTSWNCQRLRQVISTYVLVFQDYLMKWPMCNGTGNVDPNYVVILHHPLYKYCVHILFSQFCTFHPEPLPTKKQLGSASKGGTLHLGALSGVLRPLAQCECVC